MREPLVYMREPIFLWASAHKSNAMKYYVELVAPILLRASGESAHSTMKYYVELVAPILLPASGESAHSTMKYNIELVAPITLRASGESAHSKCEDLLTSYIRVYIVKTHVICLGKANSPKIQTLNENDV